MIKIKYDGAYPSLCKGHLDVWVDDKYYDFGNESLISGGDCEWCSGGGCIVSKGDWEIDEYPSDFPEELKEDLLKIINEEIPHGCCGGCE